LNENMKNYPPELFDSLKDVINMGAEHGLVEVTHIDEYGEFIYVLTDKGIKFNEIIDKMMNDEELDECELWAVEILASLSA